MRNPMATASALPLLSSRLLLGIALAAAGPGVVVAQTPADARPALERLLHQQEAAWNAGDAPAWSAAFSEDADFINIRGDVFHGRAEIAERHALIFAGPFRGTQAIITIRLITQIAPGIVVLDTDYEVTGVKVTPPGIAPTLPGVLRTRMKYIAVQHGDTWKFITGQNTAVVPAMPPGAMPPPQ